MSRGSRKPVIAFLAVGACAFFPASDASAQYVRNRGGYGGFRAGFTRTTFGGGGCFVPVAPCRTACAPIIGRRAVCATPLLNSTWCRPRCTAVIVPPVVSCYNVNNFGLYPSSRLDCVSGPSFYGGYYGGAYYSSYTQSVSSVPAPDVTPNYAPPPGAYAGVSTQQVYGFRSTPVGNGNGDRALNDALLEYKRRQTGGEASAPVPPAIARADVQRAQQAGVALGRGDKEFEIGRYDRARDEYLHALLLEGDDAGAEISYGMAQFALGNYGDAAKAVRHAVWRQPVIDPASFDLRKAYSQAADFTLQVGRLEQFVAGHPDDTNALFLLGFVQACGGDPKAGGERLSEFAEKAAPIEPELAPFLDLAIGRGSASH